MEAALKRAPARYVNLPSRKIHAAAPFCAVLHAKQRHKFDPARRIELSDYREDKEPDQ